MMFYKDAVMVTGFEVDGHCMRQPSNSYRPSLVKRLIMNVNERSCQEVSKKSHGEISLTFPRHTGKWEFTQWSCFYRAHEPIKRRHLIMQKKKKKDSFLVSQQKRKSVWVLISSIHSDLELEEAARWWWLWCKKMFLFWRGQTLPCPLPWWRHSWYIDQLW